MLVLAKSKKIKELERGVRMNYERVIIDIKKAIKEHLDNNYVYDMLVNFELDVIDWNSLFEYINKLQQENQQLKINCNIGTENLNFYREEYKKLEHNWNELKEFLETNWKETQDIWFVKIINKMRDIERGVSDVED